MSVHPTIFTETGSGEQVWLRVEGKGSFQNSPALKEFAAKMQAGGKRQFVVDLKNCPSMDSTFMGTLACIAIRLRDAATGELWVINRNERNAELLGGLGLDGLFSDKPVPDQQSGGSVEAIQLSADKGAAREAMHEAHAACVAVDPRNEEKFKDVIEHLKASAAKATRP